jgi:hypothetical protein
MRPAIKDYPEFYDRYIGLTKQIDLNLLILETKKEVLFFFEQLDPRLHDYGYAPGKWTIKQVLLHCIDTERIFSYRALSFARGEKQTMLSFDEDVYAAQSNAQSRSLTNILEEFESVRQSTCLLFASFTDDVLNIKGETPSGQCTVNAIGFAICGHYKHHLQTIEKLYLGAAK